MKNTNTNNTKTYYYPPRTPEEFFDAINLEKGDEGYNLEILNSWSWEQKMQYYRECASRYEEDRRSPWEVVLESCCKRLLGHIHIFTQIPKPHRITPLSGCIICYHKLRY